MVQIIPQDVPAGTRFAQALLPPIGEGFGQGIGAEQKLYSQKRLADIQNQQALQREQQLRALNLQGLQESEISKNFPELSKSLEAQIRTGQTPDLSGLMQLQLKQSLLKKLGINFDLSNQSQNVNLPDASGSPNQQVGFTNQQMSPGMIQAQDNLDATPIELQNRQAQNVANDQPIKGPYTNVYDSMTPEQRQAGWAIIPEYMQWIKQGADEELLREQERRTTEEAQVGQLNDQLNDWYTKHNMMDADFDTPKKIIAEQTKGMNNTQALNYIQRKMNKIARDTEAFKKTVGKFNFNNLNPSEKDMKTLIDLGKKFKADGLDEWYRGKLADNFWSPYTIESIINPLQDEYKSALNKIPNRGPNIASSFGMGTHFVGKYLDNKLSNPSDKDLKTIKDVMKDAIPQGQSLYSMRQYLNNEKNIPPSWVEKAVNELIDEGITLNERQQQELVDLGLSNGESVINTTFLPWFKSLQDVSAKEIAGMLLGF